MRCNTDLYNLIQSLTKAEKRYFKMYTTQHAKKDSSNYVLLFDAIDRQEQYNEDKLRRKFRNHSFGKSIAKTKYLLYELILKMLRQLYHGKSGVSKINGLIESAQYLYTKGLYNQSNVSLQKAKKLCLELEHTYLHLQVLDAEQRLIGYKPAQNAIRAMRTWKDEYKEVQSEFQQETDYKVLLMEANSLFESARHYQLEELDYSLDAFMSHELLQSAYYPKSFLSKVYYHQIHALAACATKKVEIADSHLNILQELWQEEEVKIRVYQDSYIDFGVLYLNYCSDTRTRHLHYNSILKQLRKLSITSSGMENKRISLLVATLDFVYNLNCGHLDSCAIQYLTIRDMLKDAHYLDYGTRVNLYFHLCIFHFLRGDHQESLTYVDQIQEVDHQYHYPNIQNYCRLISLMARDDQQEFDLLEYDVLKTHRFLSKKQEIKNIEKLVLTSVRKLLRVKHTREATHVFVQAYSSLQDMESHWLMPLQMTTGKAIYQWVKDKLPNYKGQVIH